MRCQSQDLASTGWYLCCSGNLAGGQFMGQKYAKTSAADALHSNITSTLLLLHISTVKGKLGQVEEGLGMSRPWPWTQYRSIINNVRYIERQCTTSICCMLCTFNYDCTGLKWSELSLLMEYSPITSMFALINQTKYSPGRNQVSGIPPKEKPTQFQALNREPACFNRYQTTHHNPNHPKYVSWKTK